MTIPLCVWCGRAVFKTVADRQFRGFYVFPGCKRHASETLALFDEMNQLTPRIVSVSSQMASWLDANEEESPW